MKRKKNWEKERDAPNVRNDWKFIIRRWEQEEPKIKEDNEVEEERY